MTSRLLKEWAAERRDLVVRSTSAVVGIERPRGRTFSGVVWDDETVVTAAEALSGALHVLVHAGAEPVDGEVIGVDLSTDVGVVRARTGLTPASRAAADSLHAGDTVVVAGREGGGPLVAWNHVEHVGPAWRSRRGGEISRAIRLAPALAESFEGAGVFDLEGKLTVMAVPGPRRRVLGIPVETIARVVAPVLEHGYLPQPFLGIRLQPVWLDEEIRARLGRRGPGVIVTGIEPGSPAAAAGVLFGDLLLSVGGMEVEGPLQVSGSLGRASIGTSVELELLRAGARQQATVVIGERSRS
jgi:serine protease DegQ